MEVLPKDTKSHHNNVVVSSAFRSAEKFYKTQGLDAPGLIDFSKALSSGCNNNANEPLSLLGNVKIEIKYIVDSHRGKIPLCSIPSRPGFLYIPNVFSTSEQKAWIRSCLNTYTSWENRTNFTVDHSFESSTQATCLSFWQWLEQNRDSTHKHSSSDNKRNSPPTPLLKAWKKSGSENGDKQVSLSRDTWLRRLRWATLGYHYDWTKKEYSKNDFSTFPADLSQLTDEIATWINVPFRAEAAIINYYHAGDTLMGHSDFSEENHNAPLFSVSFGNAAIFLIGGPTRDEEPIPILLKTGDIVIMMDDARLAYHGVPCIIPQSISPDFSALLDANADDEWFPYAEFLRSGGRINMNVRQVYF